MMNYVELGHVLDKIIKDHGKNQFGDFKSTIMAVLETFNYEENILSTTKKLLSLHMHELTNKMKILRQKAYCSKEEICKVCSQSLKSNVALFLFSCGHSFHKTCLENIKKRKVVRCPICFGDIKDKTIEELSFPEETLEISEKNLEVNPLSFSSLGGTHALSTSNLNSTNNRVFFLFFFIIFFFF